jgi:hypothetical protein
MKRRPQDRNCMALPLPSPSSPIVRPDEEQGIVKRRTDIPLKAPHCRGLSDVSRQRQKQRRWRGGAAAAVGLTKRLSKKHAEMLFEFQIPAACMHVAQADARVNLKLLGR